MWTSILLITGAYLLGSISAAILVSHALQLPDPRTTGSGNPGATNMLRIGGKKAGVLSLLGDMFKGTLPVLLAKWLDVSTTLQAATGFAAFMGHLFPVFFRFRGGKGVATTLGVALGLYWPIGLAALVSWIAVAVVSKLSSLAALIASLLIPVYFYLLYPEGAFIIVTTAITTILFYKHHTNIRKLVNGTERRIGDSAR